MKAKMNNLFRNLKLSNKINIIIFSAIALISITGLISITILTQYYNNELYDKNAIALKYIISDMETELRSIITMTDYLISNETIQSNLITLQDSTQAASKSKARRVIYDTLYSYMDASSAISYITLLTDDFIIHMGETLDFKQIDTRMIYEQTNSMKGKILWVGGDANQQNILCTRQIRQKAYLNLRNLAVLYVKVDIDKIISNLIKSADIPKEDLNISFFLEDGTLIYPSDFNFTQYCADFSIGAEPYIIDQIDGQSYFITSGIIPVTGWNYINFSDYNKLFSSLNIAVKSCMVLFILSALLAILNVHFIIRNITRHFHILEDKMKYFEAGHLEPLPGKYNYVNRKDEIGVIHQLFDQTVLNFQKLINDNYIKQLLLKDTRIKMLEQQINPHFLYNVLDCIYWRAESYHAKDISEMSLCLAELFRASIYEKSDCIKLSREIEFLQSYIKIQKLRFNDRLIFESEIPEQYMNVLIPKLSIQPLVENAVKHAMDPSEEPCEIRLFVKEEDEMLKIYISNTGSQFNTDLWLKLQNQELHTQAGIGLSNIDSRLKLIYGDSYRLKFYNENGRAIVYFCIPR